MSTLTRYDGETWIPPSFNDVQFLYRENPSGSIQLLAVWKDHDAEIAQVYLPADSDIPMYRIFLDQDSSVPEDAFRAINTLYGWARMVVDNRRRTNDMSKRYYR